MQIVDGRHAADGAIDAAILGRDGTLDSQEVVAGILFDSIPDDFLGLVPGRRLDCLHIVQRDDAQDGIGNQRVGRLDQRFGATSTGREIQPVDGRTGFCFQRLDHLGHQRALEPQVGGGQRAKLHKIPSTHAATAGRFVDRFVDH